MESIFVKLIEQLPSAAAIIIVVVYFIKYIQKRDEQESARSGKTLDVLSAMGNAITTIAKNQDAHHTAMLDAVSDMRNVTRQRTRDAAAKSRKSNSETEE